MQSKPQLLEAECIRYLMDGAADPRHYRTRDAPSRCWGFRIVLAIYDCLWGILIGVWVAVRFTLWASFGARKFWHRLGYLPRRPKNSPIGVWLHAASVGEWLSAQPVLGYLKRRHPDWWVVLTTTNRDAFDAARAGRSGTDAVGWLPWDYGSCIERALDRIRADLLVLVECELWPNLIVRAARRKTRVMMMNARIYERDLPHYLLARRFFEPVLRMISYIGSQSESNRARFIRLGAPAQNVVCTGYTKFDVAPPADLESQLLKLRAMLPLSGGPLWVLASTHPNEEEQVLSRCLPLRQRFPGLQFLIAPRHVSRASAIVTMAERLGLQVVQRSLLSKDDLRCSHRADQPDVILLDTIGELRTVLGLADLVFVGGSLVNQGGQNPIESCMYSKATLIGPNVSNFEEVVAAFRAARAVVPVRDADELLLRASQLLADVSAREELGRRASAVVRRHKGAAEVYAQMLERYVMR